MNTQNLTAFSFGYWGWGNHTKELVSIIDKTEAMAGYKRPIFVDVRFRREVQALGFQGKAFESLVGQKRYKWIKGLGNSSIGSGTGIITISDPATIKDLMETVLSAEQDRRRVIYFCACQIPRTCHRHTVGQLLVKEARKRQVALTVVEWPGGEPRQEELRVSDKVFKAVARGRKSVPLTEKDKGLLTLPWYSIVNLVSENIGDTLPIGTGPARFSGDWQLPVLETGALNEAPSRMMKWAKAARLFDKYQAFRSKGLAG